MSKNERSVVVLEVMQAEKPEILSPGLKKTCRKNGISFWDYLKNRLLGVGDIPPLSEVIRAAGCQWIMRSY